MYAGTYFLHASAATDSTLTDVTAQFVAISECERLCTDGSMKNVARADDIHDSQTTSERVAYAKSCWPLFKLIDEI